MDDPFSAKLQAWREYTGSPWGRIRYAVVAEILRRHCADLGGGLRVLDVGGGDALDTVPLALAGHDVTVVDPSPGWLDAARVRAERAGATISTLEGGLDDLPRGEWDLVLCHFVLRYRPAGSPDLPALALRVRPGGRLSVMDINPSARLLRELVTHGPDAALRELEADHINSATFGVEARKVYPDATAEELAAVGLVPIARYGTRIANDLLTDDEAKHDAAYFARLLQLELALCDREPFLRVGGVWQLIAERVP